jgi:hypothetical protein
MKRLDDLDAYVTGELTGAAAEAFEEAMFDAPDDPGLNIIEQLQRHGPRLVEHGTWDMGSTPAAIDKLVAAGHIVQICDCGPPSENELTIRPDIEFLVTILSLGSHEGELVDVDVTIVKYGITKTIKDSRVHSDGKLYGLCERALAELAFGQDTIVRVRERTEPRKQLAEWRIVGDVA